jgi:hypothetical protein
MDELPEEVQDRKSATFTFGRVKSVLRAGYFRGPAANDDNDRGGMRTQALRGKPASHRKSILRKAVESNLLKETPEGFATTPFGCDLLKQMFLCPSCGGETEPYRVVVKTGRRTAYVAVLPMCPSCDDPLSFPNTGEYTRGDEQLRKAVEVMESDDVVCYLNGKSIEQTKQDLGI